MGVPVVATDLPEVRRFNADYGDVVSVAANADAFAAAVQKVLGPSTPEEIERRIAVAHDNSWVRRLAAMRALIDEAFARHAQPRWDETLRRVYQRTRSRAAIIIIALLTVYGLLFETNALWWAAEPLRISAPPSKADAIVVFAGGVGESGKAGGGHQERVKRAVDLYEEGYADGMVLSSGFVYSFKEAEVMRALAIDQGIPPSHIVLEEHSKNTYENVMFVNRIIGERRWHRILLVSSPYHMRRALLVWHKVAPEVVVVPAPPDSTMFYEHTRGASLEQIRGIVWEYLAIFEYWRRGWI
jgi:uncharacterized SAM-binding protein YcdF (DUF218 family)